MSDGHFTLETKEYTFKVAEGQLQIDSASAFKRDLMSLDDIIHLNCDSASASKRFIGMLMVILALIGIYITYSWRLDMTWVTLSLIVLILGVILILHKTHTSKLTVSLSNGEEISFDTTVEKEKVFELMTHILPQSSY